MKRIYDEVRREDHFAATCCSIALFRRCLITAVDAVCKDVTGPETSKYIDSTVTDAVGEFSELVCTKTNTIGLCSQNYKGFDGLKTIMDSDVKPQNSSTFFNFLNIAIKYED